MSSIPSSVQVLGLVWYEKEDFQQCRFIMKDGSNLPRTYEEWERKAKMLEQHIRSQGVITIRALIRPNEFLDWCGRHGHDVNAKGRNAFASFIAMQAHRDMSKQ